MSHGKIFVIDDEDENLAYLEAIIKAAGYDVETSSDGAEALTRMQAQVPDMVFLDVQMPGMNGFQVLKSIRQTEDLAEVPVVLLSAISAVTGDEYDPDVIESRYGVRPSAFVSKPIEPELVQEQLTIFVGNKQS
jgi:putative two-component system response regulator